MQLLEKHASDLCGHIMIMDLIMNILVHPVHIFHLDDARCQGWYNNWGNGCVAQDIGGLYDFTVTVVGGVADTYPSQNSISHRRTDLRRN